MTTDHWYAYRSELPYDSDVAVKLPTDPRTLIKVYRAAMRWHPAWKNNRGGESQLAWELATECAKALKKKGKKK